MLRLGAVGKDVITGFTGVITTRVQSLGTKDRYQLTGTADEKGIAPELWTEEDRIEVSGAMVKLPGGVTS